MSKRHLQIATAILGAIPVLTGIIGLLGLSDPLYASANLPANALLDSNLRFFSGIWLGLGLAAFWLIPGIDRQTVLFRTVWGLIFLGGVGRLLSMVFSGMPPAPFIAFTVLEIVGAPIFVLWQSRLATAVPEHAGLNRIGQIAVPVTDVDRAVAFYRDVLGMRFLFQAPPGLGFFDVGGVRLMLDGPARAQAGNSSVIYYQVPELNAAVATLKERGVAFEAEPHLIAKLPDHDLWMAFFRDPDRNLIALMSEIRN